MSSFKISARENGPYLIPATASYLDDKGNIQAAPGKSLALCRCGQSSNSPFCDGSHKQADFQAPATELDCQLS